MLPPPPQGTIKSPSKNIPLSSQMIHWTAWTCIWTKMSDDVANAATSGSLDDADISSMAKTLEILTLANSTLVK